MDPSICSSFCPRRIVVMLAAVSAAVVSAHAQTLTVLHTFTSRPDGLTPIGGVIMDQSGNLYGTTAQGGTGTRGTVFKIDTSGNETVLHSFVARPDGLDPEADLVIDSFGNLYGTTQIGGSQGKGTIFKIDTSGNETVLHSFLCCPPLGKNPVAGLIFDGSGNLYGTAQNGGEHGQNGTVFKLSPSGMLTVLHDFNAIIGDGHNPLGSLLFDPSGNLFGTTYQGGTQNQGTVFAIDNAGNYSVIYSFGSNVGIADGKWPRAGVIRDQFGNLYGTTSKGGEFNGGTVFIIPEDGTGEFVVHSFGAPGDGQWPYGVLAIDADGNLYGTTISGGAAQQGTVFKIEPLGENDFSYSVLHSFNGNDGSSPAAGVIVGADGNLYGTCSQGGPGNGGFGTGGTVFKLSLH